MGIKQRLLDQADQEKQSVFKTLLYEIHQKINSNPIVAQSDVVVDEIKSLIEQAEAEERKIDDFKSKIEELEELADEEPILEKSKVEEPEL